MAVSMVEMLVSLKVGKMAVLLEHWKAGPLGETMVVEKAEHWVDV